MRVLKIVALLVFSLTAVIAWGEPFMDNFDRPDSADLGNGWSTQKDGTITAIESEGITGSFRSENPLF